MAIRDYALLEGKWGLLAIAGLGISLHVMATPSFAGIPIRMGLSDLLLPFLVLVACWSWYRENLSLAIWREPAFIGLLALFIVWFAGAIVIGRLRMGEWFSWALFQKGVGLLVLVGYFLSGAAIARWGGSRGQEAFLTSFLVTGWVTSAFSLVFYTLYLATGDFGLGTHPYFRAQGFSENPNAFGVSCAVLAAVQLILMRLRPIFPRWLALLGLCMILGALFFARSRTAWFAFPPVVLVLLVLRAISLRDVLLALLLTGLVIGAVLLIREAAAVIHLSGLFDLNSASKEANLLATQNLMDGGAMHRLLIAERALEMWVAHPLVGIGIGSFYHGTMVDKELVGGAMTIHSTPIWILVESGVVGFGILLVTVVVAVRRTFLDYVAAGDIAAALGLATILIMTIASVGAEILYQRYLWVLLGFALVVSPPASPIPLRPTATQ